MKQKHSLSQPKSLLPSKTFTNLYSFLKGVVFRCYTLNILRIFDQNYPMKIIFSAAVFFFLSMPLFGQLRKVIHTTFDVDEANSILFDLYDEYEVELWAGDNIMTETTIKLYEGSEGILKHFIENGRYEIEIKLEETALTLVSKDKERKPIKTRKGECFEQVNHKIFLPDTFEQGGENQYTRVVKAPEKITKDN